MVMLAKIFCFFILILGFEVNGQQNSSVNYTLFVDQIIASFAKAVEQEFGLVCIGDGGKMPYDVEEIEVIFIAYQNASVEQARELEIKITEKLVKAINLNDKIRPYLREYPFGSNRAKVSISFRKGDNSCYKDGSVVQVFQAKNRIFYRGESVLTQERISLGEEPYEDALKIVQTSKQNKT